MPAPLRSLSLQGARTEIQRMLEAPRPGPCVGLEVEWITRPTADSAAPVSLGDLQDVLAGAEPPPAGSRVTFEPGAQLELSSVTCDGVAAACAAVAADHAWAEKALAERGIELAGVGFDPWRVPERQLLLPRYAAMEAYFDRHGPAGRRMMRATAAVQVNVDCGDGPERDRRWRVAHAVGPTLAAVFACSPLAHGRPTGWASTRLATWQAMDSTRTAPVGGHGIEAYVDYALRAAVMLVRTGDDGWVPLDRHLPFAAWVAGGHELGWPTAEDLAYHLTTLFPPVRPRGWLEVRFLDALPHRLWAVAAAVTVALLCDEDAGTAATWATSGLHSAWDRAARWGLRDPDLAGAGARIMAAALRALPSVGAGADLVAACDDFADRYTRRARSPADDLLEVPAWT